MNENAGNNGDSLIRLVDLEKIYRVGTELVHALRGLTLDIAENDIEDAPSFGVSVDTNFILGMGKVEGNVKILLDISMVLSGDDLSSLEISE